MRKYAFVFIAVAFIVATTLTVTGGTFAQVGGGTGSSPNLLAHWTFEAGLATEITGDVTGNGNFGLVVGPISTAGKIDDAFDFDGVDDYINAGPIINYPTDGVSLTAWVNADVLANCGASDCRIASKATGTAEQAHDLMLSTIKSGGGVKLRFRLKAGGRTTTLISSTNLINGHWIHVAGTYDGSDMRIYVDGNEAGSTEKAGTIDSAPSVPFWIGGNPDSPTSKPWDGKIDDVRIYDGALSLAVIQELSQSTPSVPPPDPSLVSQGSLMSGFVGLQPSADTASPQWFSPVGQGHRGASVAPAPPARVETLSPGLDGIGRALSMRSLTPNTGSVPWKFTLFVDGIATPLVCSIPVGATECSSGATVAVIPAGSLIAFEFDHAEQLPTETTVAFGWVWSESNDVGAGFCFAHDGVVLVQYGNGDVTCDSGSRGAGNTAIAFGTGASTSVEPFNSSITNTTLVAIGPDALSRAIGGDQNIAVAIGEGAEAEPGGGSENTLVSIGFGAFTASGDDGGDDTIGNIAVSVGTDSEAEATGGENNTAIAVGNEHFVFAHGENNTSVAVGSGNLLGTSGGNNTAVGISNDVNVQARVGENNIAISTGDCDADASGGNVTDICP